MGGFSPSSLLRASALGRSHNLLPTRGIAEEHTPAQLRAHHGMQELHLLPRAQLQLFLCNEEITLYKTEMSKAGALNPSSRLLARDDARAWLPLAALSSPEVARGRWTILHGHYQTLPPCKTWFCKPCFKKVINCSKCVK